MQYFSHVFEPSLNRFMRRRPLFQCFISWSAFWTLNFWIFIGNQHKAFKAWFSLFSCYLLLGIIWNNENTHFFGTDGSVWFCISYLGHIWYIYHVCIYIYICICLFMNTYSPLILKELWSYTQKHIYIYIYYIPKTVSFDETLPPLCFLLSKLRAIFHLEITIPTIP